MHYVGHLHAGKEPFGHKLGLQGRGHVVEALEDLRWGCLAAFLCQDQARSVDERRAGGERERERASGRQTAHHGGVDFGILFVPELHETQLQRDAGRWSFSHGGAGARAGGRGRESPRAHRAAEERWSTCATDSKPTRFAVAMQPRRQDGV